MGFNAIRPPPGLAVTPTERLRDHQQRARNSDAPREIRLPGIRPPSPGLGPPSGMFTIVARRSAHDPSTQP